ncbi:hypothetical protein [Moorena producens]|uniref:hypothetical protein n=1 Tax=Moorena producens TaxID=1155739 RepID=UPI001314E3E3|nr:hypothetical protein [Moorena producens]
MQSASGGKAQDRAASLFPIPYAPNNVEFSEPRKLVLYQSITISIATGYHQEER